MILHRLSLGKKHTFKTFVKNCLWVLKTPLGKPVVPAMPWTPAGDKFEGNVTITWGENYSCIVFRLHRNWGINNVQPSIVVCIQGLLKRLHAFPLFSWRTDIQDEEKLQSCFSANFWRSRLQNVCSFRVEDNKLASSMPQTVNQRIQRQPARNPNVSRIDQIFNILNGWRISQNCNCSNEIWRCHLYYDWGTRRVGKRSLRQAQKTVR